MAIEIQQPDTQTGQQHRLQEAFAKGWNVVVWNDPVNLMSYVIYVFRQVLGFDPPTAQKHMLEVHHQGKSCVAQEKREVAEFYWQRLQQFGLKTTLEKNR
ncbi:MAG: ATP-dependent Clp protease adapter ClpS [Verrucomicrobiota bacterium]